MATIYVFNENELYASGSAGEVKTFNILGYQVKATVGKDGYARVNASPFYRAAMFGGEDANCNDTSFVPAKNYGGNTYKYGYMGIDETAERFSTQRSKYSENSQAGECQAMLRWLDHYGNWCYWVFELGTLTWTDAQRGETLTTVINGCTVSRPHMKAMALGVTMCAPMVDEETFEFLADLRNSINVCMLGMNEWIPVVVASGSQSWVRDSKRKKRQDFELTVVEPETVLSL